MDCLVGMKKTKRFDKRVRVLAENVKFLQEEIKAMMYERDQQNKAYERDMMLFALREAEWKQERKKLKEEVKGLRKVVEEREERIRREMEDVDSAVVKRDQNDDKQQLMLGNDYSFFFIEQMREERLWRDEAVDKWKKLYLAIKTELDNLLQRTHHGDGLYLRAEEEDMIEELKMEVKTKEETIKELKAQLAIVEHEGHKKAREVDILRQSLRIISSKKGIKL